MERLVFIDDDKTELENFHHIVGAHYDYITVHWPDESDKLFSLPPPEIFVSDLYLPAASGDVRPTTRQRDEMAKRAGRVAERFSGLFSNPLLDDKARLQETMKGISDAYAMLEMQWRALGQSPEHGVELLRKVKERHPEVPFVFYSRKITPEDVIHVLRAGAVDAIRKGALKDEEVLVRLATAQRFYRGGRAKQIREQGPAKRAG